MKKKKRKRKYKDSFEYLRREKLKKKIIDGILLTVIAVALSIIVFNFDGKSHKTLLNKVNEITNNASGKFITTENSNGEQTDRQNEIVELPKENINIRINQPIALSWKTQKEVFSIRQKYVGQSVFARPGYKPSDEVFGQIEDGKPWMSSNICQPEDAISPDGPSEESRELINPSILVTIDDPFWRGPYEYCPFKTVKKTLPVSAMYYGAEKRIDVWYNPLNDKFSYMLKGVNARDFGYNYAYIDYNLSKNAGLFNSGNNITNDVIEFADFIHVGPSCGIDGGCNNGSPFQPYLEFSYNGSGDAYKEHILYIKLWKQQPQSKEQKPDFVERLIILPYSK